MKKKEKKEEEEEIEYEVLFNLYDYIDKYTYKNV